MGREEDEKTVWRRWLDPSNLMAIARGLGILFMLALGGYVWLLKLEWKIDALVEKHTTTVAVVTAHNAGAEEWKRRILLIEDHIEAVEQDIHKHTEKSAHDDQSQETARMRVQINNLIRAVEQLREQYQAMSHSGAYAVKLENKNGED